MKVLYLATTGVGDPTKASIPLHIAANGSVEAGQECAVVLVGDATELVSRETAEHVEGVGVPPARDLVRELDHAARVRAHDRGVRPGRDRLILAPRPATGSARSRA